VHDFDPTRPTDPAGATLAQVAAVVPGLSLVGDPNLRVTGATVRAQQVRPGDLFAAVPGTVTHGARFVGQAAAGGALAVLTDPDGAALLTAAGGAEAALPILVHADPRVVLGEVAAVVYGAPSHALTLIGITGTSGKTTTSYLVEAALAADGAITGLVGTVGAKIAGAAVPSTLTTPEGTALQGLLATMVEHRVSAAVMEVSSHALAQNRVGGCRFAVGAFTNLSQDHLDYHPTFEDYFAAKALLFVGAGPVCERAVICVDDEWGRRLAGMRAAAGTPMVTVSTTATAPGGTDAPDYRARDIVAHPDGSQTFTLYSPHGATEVTVGLPGAYNVANAAVALAIAAEAGVPPAVAAPALKNIAVPGRVQRIDRGQDFLAVVDYAHKPAAIDAVIATLRGQSRGRIAVVVGAGGDRDTGKRPLMGAAAARAADLVIVTDDNPRTEDPALIRAAVLTGAQQAAAARADSDGVEVREVGDRRAAIVAAVEWARAGDVVLVAGKGHEAGQEIHGVKHPFDDRDEVAAALDARLAGADARPAGAQEGR
jgi:UDP-N-acetylmuramoyl-L-alanyl-D-glutamate--2,6-diaminopimelate ligase